MSPPVPISDAADHIDLSARIVDTVAITGSPAAAVETIIATLTIPNFAGIAVVQKIYLDGWAAFTVGTNGTAVRLRIRQTDASGTIIADSGALTGGIAAAALVAQDIAGSDASPGITKYVLTLTVTAASAASTVSAVSLRALIV